MSNSSSEQDNKPKDQQGFTSQKLNFTLAICAILISAASFYATYLQASAAEKQVKAMTLPLIQYDTGNLDDITKLPVIEFSLENAGVGPALIKSVNFSYQGETFDFIQGFFKACCSEEYKIFVKKMPQLMKQDLNLSLGGMIQESVVNKIIPAQEEVKFYRLYKGEFSNELWSKLNDERRKLKVSICYCSLLDNCYITEKNGVVEPVDACPVEN